MSPSNLPGAVFKGTRCRFDISRGIPTSSKNSVPQSGSASNRSINRSSRISAIEP
jgi:hypothetical protein